MSIGGGSNKQKSSSSSTSTNESLNLGSDIWGPQAPYLADFYSRANQNFDYWNQNGQGAGAFWGDMASGENQNASARLFNAEVANNQMGTNLGYASDALRGFLNPTTTDPLSQAYATQMGQQFNEQFMPGLRGDAAVAGGLGGSRQQIGAALGSQRAMQSIGDFNASLYNNQQNRALAAAQGLGTVASGYGDQASGFGNIAAGRLAVSQNDMNLGNYGQQMPWAQLQMYQGLLGSPIMQDLGGWTKGTSTGTGSGSGSGWNANAGWS